MKPISISLSIRLSVIVLTVFYSLLVEAQSSTDLKEKISWTNIAPLFKTRYLERSPDRNAEEAARLRELIGGGFRLDPTFSAEYSLTKEDSDDTLKTKSYSISQKTPWGTGLEAHQAETTSSIQSSSTPSTTTTIYKTKQGITLSQELLKGGPIFGGGPGDLATTQKELEDLAAFTNYQESFFQALKAFINVEKAKKAVAASEEALKRTSSYNAAIKSLVDSGYKAKADLLVSEASEVRARLNAELTKKSLHDALLVLNNVFFQEAQEPNLDIIPAPIPESLRKNLSILNLPEEPPALKKAQLELKFAEVSKKNAIRKSFPELNIAWTLDQIRAKRTSDATPSGDPEKYNETTISANFSMPLVSSFMQDETKIAEIARLKAESGLIATLRVTKDSRLKLKQDIASAEQSLKAAEELYSLSNQAFDLEQQKYRDGKSTVYNLRSAQEDMDASDLEVIAARANLLIAQFTLARDAGVLQKVFQ